MNDKIVLRIQEIEKLNEKELCMYARRLGINLHPYADELESGKFLLRKKDELLSKVLERRSTVLLEEQMTLNLDTAKRASTAALVSAIFAGIAAILAIITIILNSIN
jgi:hypothetical protein